jgi:hypothetical protein
MAFAAAVFATMAALVAGGAPASAYGPGRVVCDRQVAHRGDTVECVFHHWPKHHRGTEAVIARFWVHKHHHSVLTKHQQTKVLKHFVTSPRGGRHFAFTIPSNIRLGSHKFVTTVGHTSQSLRIRIR